MTTPSASNPNLPPHRKVRVDLGPRSYDVLIGRRLLAYAAHFIRVPPVNLVGFPILVSDDNIPDGYRRAIIHSFSLKSKSPSEALIAKDFPVKLPLIMPGEESKSLQTYAGILASLARAKVPRTAVIMALGGGVIGDLAGFVAATYLRGINFVQMPTTLLAMVDSSVGGKTGVNLPEGKNLVGAFHQPKLVVADLDTLKTLPAPEFSAGMAEVIKYGAIADAALFDRVAMGVKPDDADLDEIVGECVAIKARIVEKDEFETKGQRALLNFGHTIGHAIERAGNYQQYLHGEAISLGMRAAAWLSVWQAGLPEADARRIELALTANGLPVTLKPSVDHAAILNALGNDKKVAADGKNRWVLLKKLGKATSGWELPPEVVEKAVDLLLRETAR